MGPQVSPASLSPGTLVILSLNSGIIGDFINGLTGIISPFPPVKPALTVTEVEEVVEVVEVVEMVEVPLAGDSICIM